MSDWLTDVVAVVMFWTDRNVASNQVPVAGGGLVPSWTICHPPAAEYRSVQLDEPGLAGTGSCVAIDSCPISPENCVVPGGPAGPVAPVAP